MMTLNNYRPSPIRGPYRRRVNWLEIALSALAHIIFASILAYAVLGMAGAWDEAQACIQCAGGVR
jgi:hypothetical protein